MANIDVVARLQLQASQFSSETGAAFATMKTRAASAAQEVRSAFAGSFAEVQKLASQSLVMPRTTGGSLDLSAEIATLKDAAAAAEQRSTALRELSVAQTAAAGSARVDAEAMRLEADASAVASLAAERDAQVIRDRIAALGVVQTELNRTTSGTKALTEAQERHAVSAGQQRQAMQQLGFQINDVATQFSSGTPPLQIFAQQSGQVIQSLQLMTTKTTGLIGFLGGPWGAILGAATVVLVPFVAKLFEASDAAKAAEIATSGLGDAESALADVFGKTSSKIAEQNELLKLNARIKAINLRADAAKDAKDGEEAFGKAGRGDRGLGLGVIAQGALSGNVATIGAGLLAGAGNPAVARLAARARAAQAIKDTGQQTKAFDAILRSAEKTDFTGSAIEKADFIGAVSKSAASRANTAIATLLDKSLDAGKIDPLLQKPTGGGGSRTGTLDAQAKLAAATTARERAEASLALTRSKSKAELDAGTISEAEYTSRVTAGERAVDRAKDAEKAATAARRESNKERREAVSLAEQQQQAEQRIANISGRFDAAPRLQDQMAAAQRDLQLEIDKYDKLTDAVSRSIVAKARAAQAVVAGAPERIFGDYVRQQGQSLAIQQLVLQGRDAEANALQQALRLQEQGVAIDDRHLAQLLDIEERQRAIADAIEDQRRVVGIYLGTVSDLQRTFDSFLASVEKRPGKAIGGLFSGIVADFRQLGRNLTSQSLFGGLERKVEDAMRQALGGAAKTPAEILRDQAKGAGQQLGTEVGNTKSALAELSAAFRAASSAFAPAGGTDLGAIGAPTIDKIPLSAFIDLSKGSGLDLSGNPANDNEGDIVVTGKAIAEGGDRVSAAATFLGTVVDGLGDNLHKLGIDLPKALTDGIKARLPDVIKGIGFGQLGGSVFASITGGKASGLGSTLGGIGGEIAGKALAKPIAAAIGGTLGKTLGGAAGPIGSIVSGIAGSALAGLFKSAQKSSATLTFGNAGLGVGSVTGTSAALKAAATSQANGVIAALNQIADAVGGSITGAGSVSIGTKNGKYVVDTTGQGRTSYGKANDGITAYATQEEAIAAATRDALSDGVIKGVSQASQTIIRSGQDLTTAISKVTLIEAVPKTLKAMLDPIGAAIDELNLKFAKTVAALKEGGATAEQMADAQRLYDLQLAQVKASTDSASATLKGFLKDLMLGSSSPFSLRDQEATAKASLQPFLDQINAGQSIDQSKYQEAAKSFLDVERQLYGSTQGYFDALDQIQAATNKAISTINNATPITAAVDSPFASQTAASAAATASNTQTGNEIASDQTDLLLRIAQAVEALGGDIGETNDFIGTKRSFVNAA